MIAIINNKWSLGNKNGYYFVKLGNEGHYRKYSALIWVNRKLVDEEGYLILPARAKLVKTSKGNTVLRPDEEYITFDVFVPCGYRGSSKIRVIEGDIATELVEYYEYRSPRGNLGISMGKVVSFKSDYCVLYWSRTGRTYGAPTSGYIKLYKDGRYEELMSAEYEDNELKELLD